MAPEIYYIDIEHEGLNKYRRIKGSNRAVVELMAEKQKAQWDEIWARKKAREAAALKKQRQKKLAQERTARAVTALQQLENLLTDALSTDPTINWDSLKRNEPYPKSRPRKPNIIKYPLKPDVNDPAFRPKLIFIDKIRSSRRLRKEAEAAARYKQALKEWEKHVKKVQKANSIAQEQYELAIKKWEEEKQRYINEQELHNKGIEHLKNAYQQKDATAVAEYCKIVLSNSKYPDYFPNAFNTEYNKDTGVLVVEYALPSPDTLPRLREVRYIMARDEFREIFLSESAIYKMFDDFIYKVALRTIHLLFKADQINAIISIVFNGWVRSIDRATGKETNACIMSVHARKDEFQDIQLAKVDPKACFRRLGGIAASKLHALSPIVPILRLDKEDSRFISSYPVADALNESTNLAAMDWKDFEHLIRELFEKEFSSSGGEVKVTQASRDGGVDAVAFDPDPIRGGKIVIQAKRYTNIVGAAAVRDLYGTVVNEGANKGILVTTSDYGADAYEFAKDKPITLLNGANLLHLLNKHGYKAKIDLTEARLLLAEQEKK